MNRLEIKSAVVCEEIREEASGKHILIGVTNPEIGVYKLPGKIKVALWVCVLPTEVGPFAFEFRVMDPENNPIVTGAMDGVIDQIAYTTVVFNSVGLSLNKEGVYRYEWAFGPDKWETLFEIMLHQF